MYLVNRTQVTTILSLIWLWLGEGVVCSNLTLHNTILWRWDLSFTFYKHQSLVSGLKIFLFLWILKYFECTILQYHGTVQYCTVLCDTRSGRVLTAWMGWTTGLTPHSVSVQPPAIHHQHWNYQWPGYTSTGDITYTEHKTFNNLKCFQIIHFRVSQYREM